MLQKNEWWRVEGKLLRVHNLYARYIYDIKRDHEYEWGLESDGSLHSAVSNPWQPSILTNATINRKLAKVNFWHIAIFRKKTAKPG